MSATEVWGKSTLLYSGSEAAVVCAAAFVFLEDGKMLGELTTGDEAGKRKRVCPKVLEDDTYLGG